MTAPVDLDRLRALSGPPLTMSLSDIEELRALAAAAAAELEEMREDARLQREYEAECRRRGW